MRFRDLLYMLTWRDVCIRYKQSIFGILWVILMPTVIVLAGVLMKTALATVSGKAIESRDLALIAVKAVPWALFVASIRASTNCLIGNANLVTKIKFPKVILPIAAVSSQLFDFAIASVILCILLVVLGIGTSLAILWVPVLILILLAMALGVGMFLASSCLFFRDVKPVVELFLMFAIFFTPVFYEVAMFKQYGELLMLNPMAPILEGLGAVVVDHRAPDLLWLGYSSVVAIVALVGSYAFFRHFEPAFAECI
jgi:ABC-type polysaccharide/polyol phosphate export permease